MQLTEPLMVWRLVRARRVEHAFDGEGARLHGGRWNHPGTPVVYTSSTLSLAALELFVNLQQDTVPDDLVALAASLPPGMEVEALDRTALPEDWRRYPALEAVKDLGTAWQREGLLPILEVPSAVVPQESNYLLNPAHPDLGRMEIGEPQPFSFDTRMWKPS